MYSTFKEKRFTIPFEENDQVAKDLVELVKSFAVYKGLLKRDHDLKYVPIQFCLFPSLFPKNHYDLIRRLQPVFNHVLHQVAHSRDFLAHCFSRSIQIDDFTARLWEIYETVHGDVLKQPIELEISRCDYMLHVEESDRLGIKQVENNTMACAMPNLSPISRDLHALAFDYLGMRDEISRIPPNHASSGIAQAIVTAWRLYGNKNAVILFVVEGPSMSNICDHRALEFEMWHMDNDIRVLRCTFAQLQDTAHLSDGNLYVNNKEVALVYYRWGYAPQHYTDKDWDMRLMIERSKAIKCPTAGYHLAGSKRVQMELTRPSVLESFLPPDVDALEIQHLFAKQYILDMGTEGDRAVALALANPHEYVLKAEREGGGNNYYDDDIVKLLTSVGHSEARQVFILMEKINAPPYSTFTVPNHAAPRKIDVCMEIGIYGFAIWKEGRLLENKDVGYVVKSKEHGTNEGGLCSGYSYLDSPFLY